MAYWQVKDDYFNNTQKSSDGKFHAYKMNSRTGRVVKDVAFGKRKTAKARAYKWYCKRKELLEKRQLNRKPKVRLSEREKKIRLLKKKIENADRRMANLKMSIVQSRSRIVRAKNKRDKWMKKNDKWMKKKVRWMRELGKLQSENLRVKAFVDTL